MTETIRHTPPLTPTTAEWPGADPGVLRLAQRRREDNPSAALRLLDDLNAPGRRHADPAGTGRGSLLRAQVLTDLGDYERAAGAIQSARHDLLAAGLTLEAFASDLVRGRLVRVAGDGLRSVDIIENVLSDLPDATMEADSADWVSLLRAHAHRQLGLSLAATNQHLDAVRHLDLAWNRFHALDEPVYSARTATDRATSYLELDMAHRALDDLERGQRLLLELGQVTAAARCAITLSHVLVRLDRIPEAVHALEDARPVLAHRGNRPEMAALDLAMAEALLHAGLGHDARLEAQAAVDLFTSLDHIEGTAHARFVSGVASLLSCDVATALPEIALAERLVTSPRLRQELALVHLCELLTSRDRLQVERARELAAHAHAEATISDDPSMRVIAELATAFVAHDPIQARRHLDEARRNIHRHDLHGLDIGRAVVTATVMRHQDDLLGAVDEITTALTRASSPQAHADGSYRPLAHLLLIAAADRALLDLLLEIDSPDSVTEAWRWAAVTKARSLTDLASTATHHRRPRHHALELPVHREAELAMLSDALDRLIEPDGDVDLAAIRATHVSVRRDIRQQIPHARLPLTPHGTVDLPPVPEGPVLQLHPLDDDIVAFVIREGQVYSRRLVGVGPEVESAVAEWHAECSRVQSLAGHGAGDSTHHSLQTLGALLLAPLTDLLADLEGFPLVVVAPGELQTVPFEALPFDGRTLSSTFSLRFAAGMHDLGSMCQDPDALGWPVEQPRTRLLALMVPDATAPRIADETRALAAIQPDATILSGPAATVDALSRLARQHDVVHIACHGLYWPEHPSSSGLRLGDRWVTAGEILRMDLRGCLVILNACATGRAHDATSESIGLTWALLAAGASGVVATTWPVDDSVALSFASSFHRQLADGHSPPESVRLASIDVSEQFSDHPWAWAAHRYIGSGAAVIRQG